MEEEEIKLNLKRIKRIAKESLKDDNLKISSTGLEFLRDLSTEFIQLISLAGLSKSGRSKQYVDSKGIIKALTDLGFEDIVELLPDLSEYSEDMTNIIDNL